MLSAIANGFQGLKSQLNVLTVNQENGIKMIKNKFDLIREQAKNSAVKGIMKQLKKNQEYHLIKKLETLIKNGEI